MRLNVVLWVTLSSFSLYAMDNMDNTESNSIQERIQPVGQVRIQATSEASAPTLDNSKITTGVKKGLGQEVYEKHCIVCHRDGLAGAPRFENENDWKSRLNGRTIEDLVTSSIKGLNAMPARGTCMECTDKDLEVAIHYMLPKS